MAKSDILDNLKETPPRAYNDHILVIDAMNMLIRSFSLLKAMNPDGTHIGGIVGFLRSLGYVTRIFDPTRVIVVWDGKGGSANRKNINPEYKAQRATARITHWGLYDTKEQEMEALIGQLIRVQDYLECLPVTQVQIEKLEADDIMAYIAKQSSYSKKTRENLVKSLKSQYAQNSLSTLTARNIDDLALEYSFTITTGHQLNVFTGPFYFWHKIINVIELCKDLKKKYSAYNFIPVYWMASEDHDFEEINFFNFKGVIAKNCFLIYIGI